MISRVFSLLVSKPISLGIQPISQLNSYKFVSFTEKLQKKQS